jgi:hypothetical protein
MKERALTHLQFRIELYCKLLRFSERAKLQSLRIGLGGKRVFNSDMQCLHYWEKRLKQGTCAWCSYKLKCERLLKRGIKGVAKRLVGGCIFCNVPLCKEGDCWAHWHSNNVYY